MSTYAVAKTSAYWLVNNYRDAYGLFACTGILFNHESPLRPERFVTQKIIRAVQRIAEGSGEMLKLGRLDIARDWGWAPEYVEAMWLMLQQDTPQDFVIATGTTISLEEFVRVAFEQAKLNWRDHVVQDPTLFRPTDLATGRADPSRAQKILGWTASTQGVEVVKKMYQSII
jgi:GDPmannose 4,6-dehydratase